MRLALVIATAATMTLASTAPAQTPQPAPDAPPAAPMSPAPMAPAPMAPAAPAPAAPSAAAPPAELLAPPAPAAAPATPPAAPTDPVAIALISTLEHVCIPSVAGGDLAKIAKANGYRKSGDNFVLKQPGYQFTILAPGSNPTQCHVDMVHPIYPEAPAAALSVALHNWAALTRGWSLYRNDKNVEGGTEFTTRSWEHTADGKSEAMVLTTMRKADGSPMQKNADTSTMIYSSTKSPG